MEPLKKSEIPDAVKGLITLVALGFVLYLIFGGNDNKKNATNVNEKIETYSAFDINYAYQMNEVAADKIYYHKQMRISGPIGEISKGPLGGISVSISVPGTINQIQCGDLSEDDAATLQKGETAVIEGTCGGMTLGSVF